MIWENIIIAIIIWMKTKAHGIDAMKIHIQCRVTIAFTQMWEIIHGNPKVIHMIQHQTIKNIKEAFIGADHVKEGIFSINLNLLCHCEYNNKKTIHHFSINSFLCIFSKQFDAKSCILRMICEAKHYLLPPGKSLFQDIFRVLFTWVKINWLRNDCITLYFFSHTFKSIFSVCHWKKTRTIPMMIIHGQHKHRKMIATQFIQSNVNLAFWDFYSVKIDQFFE